MGEAATAAWPTLLEDVLGGEIAVIEVTVVVGASVLEVDEAIVVGGKVVVGGTVVGGTVVVVVVGGGWVVVVGGSVVVVVGSVVVVVDGVVVDAVCPPRTAVTSAMRPPSTYAFKWFPGQVV